MNTFMNFENKIEKIEISIVIPTWNRSNSLIECINALYKCELPKNKFEIIICDSNSTDDTENKLNNFISDNNIKNLRIIHCEHNNVSLKRNVGIKNSKFDYIVLIDDDCIAEKNYLNKFQEQFLEIDNFDILCGEYKTNYKLLNKSNYLKYRDSRNHGSKNYKNKEKDLNYLDYKRIVTGNLGFKKDNVIKQNIFFNEDIIGYGGEDVDWAWRLIDSGFRLKKSSIQVIHNETSSNIINYKLKHLHFAYGAMPFLKKYNYDAAKNLPTFFLEQRNSSLSKMITFLFLRFFFNKFLISFLEFIVLHTDQYSFFYSHTIYRIIILRAYIDGILLREKGSLKQSDTKKDWYKKGYK